MIKVEHTKQYPTNKATIGGIVGWTLVTDTELVLVKTNELPSEKAINQLVRSVFGLQVWSKTDQAGYTTITGSTHIVKPILISETEKIKVGDWVYGLKTGKIYQLTDGMIIEPEHQMKILAMPQHFSPKQLQDILDDKLKEGKCLVECVQEEPIPMTYKGVDSRGDYIYYCPKCGWSGSYMGTGQVYCYKDECRPITIKLNPHVIIYPIVEEKMLSITQAVELTKQFNEKLGRISDNGTYRDLKEWFEQNVK